MTTTATANRICKYRTAKVVAILAAIRKNQWSPWMVTTDEGRAAIVVAAGVPKPSDDTWLMVGRMLERDGQYAA